LALVRAPGRIWPQWPQGWGASGGRRRPRSVGRLPTSVRAERPLTSGRAFDSLAALAASDPQSRPPLVPPDGPLGRRLRCDVRVDALLHSAEQSRGRSVGDERRAAPHAPCNRELGSSPTGLFDPAASASVVSAAAILPSERSSSVTPERRKQRLASSIARQASRSAETLIWTPAT
jgi:hypothetical protein